MVKTLNAVRLLAPDGLVSVLARKRHEFKSCK